MKRIEICGNIASGKTTLCKKLISKEIFPVLENFQKIPFIEKFYEDPSAFSFETEISFLLQHYHLIKIKPQKSNFACDFSLLQDMAYADVNLEGSRHKIFIEIVEELQKEISVPFQIIHITCREDILLDRIAKRKRIFERTISIKYLREIAKAIKCRVNKIENQISIFHVDSNSIDFTKSIGELKGFNFIS